MASESVETNATDQTTSATSAVPAPALETTHPEVTEKANESSKKKKKPASATPAPKKVKSSKEHVEKSTTEHRQLRKRSQIKYSK